MIPKIVHYCWFGNGEKPKNVRRCIDTWKRALPDYQFVEWNETNFAIDRYPYAMRAYEQKKYAFVSDVARLSALYSQGGIYLDTDVEVYGDFSPILGEKCVFGFEEKNYIATSFMACEPGNGFIKAFLDYYLSAQYDACTTNVVVLTRMLEEKGLRRSGEKQILNGEITVYPQEYFSPFDYINCVMNKTDNTICAHLFAVSWSDKKTKLRRGMKKAAAAILGGNTVKKIRDRFPKG